MKKNSLKKYVLLAIAGIVLSGGVSILAGCEDTITGVIKEEVRIKANKIHFLTMVTEGEGSTTPTGTVETTESIPYPIVAAAGTDYMFYRWSTNDSGVVFDNVYDESTNVALNSGDASVTAEFVTGNSIHLLEVVSGNTSWGTTDPNGSFNVVNNRPYTISALPASRYHFDDWTVLFGASNLTLSDPASNPTVARIVSPTSTAAKIQANFALNTYNLDVRQGSGGVGGESGDETAFEDGVSVAITAGNSRPDAVFDIWSVVSGSGVITFNNSSSPSTQVSITGGTNNQTVIVKANFKRILYIVGYEETGGVKHACYWKYNTKTGAIEKIVLGNGTNASEAKDIKMYGNTIYISGTEGGHMVYWTSDISSDSHSLDYKNTNHSTGAVGYGIFQSPDDEVYMVGEDYGTPIFYADGNAADADLYFGSGYGAAYGIYMTPSEDAYVAGFLDLLEDPKDRAVYWINPNPGGSTTTINLTDGTTADAAATSILEYGTTLYIGGWEGSNGYYWTHTNEGSGTLTKHAITGYDNNSDGKVHDIYVNSDGDVYLVGEHYSEPTSWNPNNTGQAYLDGGGGAAYGLFYCEDGSDNFYVVGYIDAAKDKAVLWNTPDVPTSSVPVYLTDGTNNARANAVISY